jgi:signal recognition particle GTPase
VQSVYGNVNVCTDMKSAQEIAAGTGVSVEDVEKILKANAEYETQRAKVEQGVADSRTES